MPTCSPVICPAWRKSWTTQWSALASGDIRQLKHQLDDLHSLPSHCHFVNYLRCHDDIGWSLNEEFGKTIGQDPLLHKKFLYEFFEGSFPGSYARGERYNYDPVTQDARTCGTTASLCGIEKGLFEGDEEQISLGIRRDLMMHAAVMCMAGFPMLSSGDEIGQLNGYGYHDDPELAEDSRNLHRTPFSWNSAALRETPGTVQQRIWNGLRKLEQLRTEEPCFAPARGCPPGTPTTTMCWPWSATGRTKRWSVCSTSPVRSRRFGWTGWREPLPT